MLRLLLKHPSSSSSSSSFLIPLVRTKATASSSSPSSSQVGPVTTAHQSITAPALSKVHTKEQEAFFNSLPGPKAYPLIRSLPFFQENGGIKGLDRMLHALHAQYGDYTKLDVPGKKMFIIFHPEDLKLILAADGKYPSPSIEGFPGLIKYYEQRDMRTNIGMMHDEGWRAMRSKMQKHILPPNAANSYAEGIGQVAADFAKGAPQYASNFKEYLARYTFEGIGNVLFGKRLGSLSGNLDPDDFKFMKYTIQMFSKGAEFTFGLPFWRYFDTPFYKEFRSEVDFIHKRGGEHLRMFIKDFAKDPEKLAHTFTGKMLTDDKMNERDLLINITGFLFAGVDTTSNILHWLFYHLAKYPEVQKKLATEFDTVLKGETSIDPDNPLPYMKACIRESFRLDPLAAGNFRTSNKEITLQNGLKVPPGVEILMANTVYYSDPAVYERPNEMIPERWFPEEKKKREAAGNTVADHPFMFLPFSFGPRLCLGMRVANLEIEAALSRFFQDYEIRLAPNQDFKRICVNFYQLDPLPKFIITPRNKRAL